MLHRLVSKESNASFFSAAVQYPRLHPYKCTAGEGGKFHGAASSNRAQLQPSGNATPGPATFSRSSVVPGQEDNVFITQPWKFTGALRTLWLAATSVVMETDC